MTVQRTAVFRPVPGGYVAYVEELPGANTQGATLDEARANIEEAVTLLIEAAAAGVSRLHALVGRRTCAVQQPQGDR